MFKNCFLTLIVLSIVSCSNAKPKEEINEEIDNTKVSQNDTYNIYKNYGIEFKYPKDYLIEEKILEEDHYFKVYLDKDDDIIYRSVQIEWKNNPIKYDPVSGRKAQKNSLPSNYSFLREYETTLNDEKVYWADYVIDENEIRIFVKSGITRIGTYVFVLQKLSDSDEENDEANEIFESIRLTTEIE